MYVKKSRAGQSQSKFLCIEDLVPENHIVRDIDKAIDFSVIYDAMCVGSIPAGRTITKFKPSSDFARRLFCIKTAYALLILKSIV